MSRAPNWRLKEAYGEIEQGTFLRPVERYFLPEHIISEFAEWDEDKFIACKAPTKWILVRRTDLEAT